jgi:hypothetical protein
LSGLSLVRTATWPSIDRWTVPAMLPPLLAVNDDSRYGKTGSVAIGRSGGATWGRDDFPRPAQS